MPQRGIALTRRHQLLGNTLVQVLVVLFLLLPAEVTRIIDDRPPDLEVRVPQLPSLRIQDLVEPDASHDAVVAYVLHAIVGHPADLLQFLEAEEHADLCKLSLLGGVAHGDYESLRPVHEYVIVHLAVSRLKDVKDVLAVGGVNYPPQGGRGGGSP